ncbi:MAG: hypothetical protein J6U48_05060 [Alistipes sp.]|nr:hypothetical protein [Alistipes sp.]
MIHEEICTYEVSKLAKEKGFDSGCLYHYDRKGSLHQHYAYDAMNSGVGVDDLLMYDGHLYTSECLAPTQSLLQRWLREEKGYYVYPFFDNEELKWTYVVRERTGEMWIPLVGFEFHLFPTYELALEDALKYALENLV